MEEYISTLEHAGPAVYTQFVLQYDKKIKLKEVADAFIRILPSFPSLLPIDGSTVANIFQIHDKPLESVPATPTKFDFGRPLQVILSPWEIIKEESLILGSVVIVRISHQHADNFSVDRLFQAWESS